MRTFEDAKQEFGLAVPPSTVVLPLKPRTQALDLTLPYYDPETETLILSPKDFQSLFDPVISKIIALINSQIMAAGKAYGSPVINVGTPGTPLASKCWKSSSHHVSSESSLLVE